MKAVLLKHSRAIVKLVEEGASVDHESSQGDTALAIAIHEKDRDSINLLLQHGARIEACNKFGHTPITAAVSTRQTDFVELLLSNSSIQAAAVLNQQTFPRDSRQHCVTPLLCAIDMCDVDMITYLLDSGAQMNVEYEDGATPLIHATRKGLQQIVSYFIQRGVDIDHENKQGLTALSVAILQDQQECLLALMQAGGKHTHVNRYGKSIMDLAFETKRDTVLFDVQAETYGLDWEAADGTTSMSQAAKYGRADQIYKVFERGDKKLVNQETTSGSTPLIEACKGAHLEAVQALIQCGADVKHQTRLGSSAFLVAAEHNRVDSHLEILEILIEAGVDMDASSGEGLTALCVAQKHDDKDTADILLRLGADPNRVVQAGATPLTFCALQNSPEFLKVMTKYVALEDVDSDGLTPLMRAAGANRVECVNVLLEEGAIIDAESRFGDTALSRAVGASALEVISTLAGAGANLDRVLNDGATALVRAILGDNLASMNKLIEVKAAINCSLGTEGLNPLMLCVKHDKMEAVQLLCESPGIALDQRNNEGKTALMIAASIGNEDAARILVKSGSQINFVNEYGRSALIEAISSGQKEMAETLCAMGADVNLEDNAGVTPLMHAIHQGAADIVKHLVLKCSADVNMSSSRSLMTPLA
eukprot:scaffold797_cov533-Prasinococcus_capsulatus_cf.AAC.1